MSNKNTSYPFCIIYTHINTDKTNVAHLWYMFIIEEANTNMYETVQIEYKHMNTNIYTYIETFVFYSTKSSRYAGLLLLLLSGRCPRK
jgi:hypothetical protein